MPPRVRPLSRLCSVPAPPAAVFPPATQSGALVRGGACLRQAGGHVRPWSSSNAQNREKLPPLSLLAHQHLAGNGPGGFVPYDKAQAAQEVLRARLLAWKNLPDNERPDPPRPHLLTFEATPTITLGRRQSTLTPAHISRLQAPLRIALPHRVDPVSEVSFRPDVRQTARGGLTTYHGPGQVVFWPVLDMHSPQYSRYSVVSYAAHLEATTRNLLAELFGLETYTNRDEPGVWAKTSAGQPERKIAALGVHHRRHVTSLGIALNVDVPLSGPEDVNPWARFVPCGLDGKLVTSVEAELQERGGGASGLAESGLTMADIAARWARLFEEGLRDETKREVDEGALLTKLTPDLAFLATAWFP
ncbi:hypothetical protein EDB81DRAFT_42153 [Dactylonectria macrodidyma]|uniref:BPL/LPL catalytic domain-containing protein n=1 Tax=Dactylonectria macrodidyma TaxID=307937 RepID=A0A9P9FVZ9_9HYPO|nr:hypothetical protein EDB81DRAFT_42153 [Dactylonectria macrodidyma]